MERTITQLSGLSRSLRQLTVLIVFAVALLVFSGCGPSDPVEEIRERIASGDLSESLELLRDYIAEIPENPEMLFLYGQVLVATGQPGLAEWPLRKAMEDPEWFASAAELIGTVEQAGGNFANAAEVYSQILEVNPENMVVRLKRANACARSPQLLEEALAEVDRILEIDPLELGAFRPKILAYLGLNKPEEAEQAIRELGTRIDEEQGEEASIRGWHCATLAIFADESGDPELAAERWASCEEKYPTHPNVVSQSIEFHTDRGDSQRALEVAEVAFASDSEGGGYRIVVANLLRLVNRPDDAEALLLEGVEQAEGVIPESASLLALVEHYKTVGNARAAAETLERTLELALYSIGPQPDLLFSLADFYIQLDEADRALDLTSQMTVAAHRSLVRARVAHSRKQYGNALRLYDETTRLWPENPYVPYHAARAAIAVGQFDRAFKSYLLSIRVDDGATDARYHAARLLQAEGQLGSALEMIGSTRVKLSDEAELFRVEVFAHLRGPRSGSNAASRLSQQRPDLFGKAIAKAAEGASRREEGGEVWTILEPLVALEFPLINLEPILRAAVQFAPGAEELAVLKPLVEKAVAANPDAAGMREIEGMYYERSGAILEAAASYRRVLEVAPDRPTVLLRLAGLDVKASPEKAIELAENALAAQGSSMQPFDPEILLALASELSDSSGVEGLLETALELAPTNGRIALRLGTILDARGEDAQRVIHLAVRALRFQAGEAALALRDRVRERL